MSDDTGLRGARHSVKCQQISTTHTKIDLCGTINLSTHPSVTVKSPAEKKTRLDFQM